MTSGTSPQWRALATAFAGMAVCIAFGRFSLGLLLPDMRDSLGLGYTAVGTLASLNLAGYLVGVVAVPRLARRTTHVRLVQAGLALATAGMVLTALPLPPFVLPVAVTVTGVAGALGWVSSAAVGVEVSNDRNRGRILGVVGTANGVGIAIASALAWGLAHDEGVPWRLVWALQAAVGFVACLVSLTVPPRTRAAVARPGALRGRLGSMHLGYGCFGLGYAWFATYYVASTTARTSLVGAQAWLVVGVGACVGAMAFGASGDRWGHARVLSASQGVAAVSSLLMMLAGERPAAVLVAGFLFGAVLTAMASLVPAVLAELVDLPHVPSAFAALTLVFAAVQTLAPTMGGVIVDHAPHGFLTLYGVTAVAFVAAGLTFARHARRPVTPSSGHH